MVKLVAIDLDGTLLNSQKKISQENIRAVQAAAKAGVQIVVCTGRPESGVYPYFKALNLGNQVEYAILNNGCSTHRIENGYWELLTHYSLTKEEVSHLVDLMAGHPEISLALTEQSEFLAIGEKVSEIIAYDASLVFSQARALSLESFLKGELQIFQAMYMGEPAVMDAFQQKVEAVLAPDFSVVRSQPYIFEVLPQGITKATGLKALAEQLDIAPQDIMAIGDAANDLEMLDFAGLSVAMGNADQFVKDLADYVTLSNDQAGVAHAIERWVLGKGTNGN